MQEAQKNQRERPVEHGNDAIWQSSKFRSIAYQALLAVIVGSLTYILYTNTQSNLEQQNIATGFDFLELEAGFEIAETVIEYWSDDSYSKALWVGLLNTFKVALLGSILALLFGIIMGVSRLSNNILLSRISLWYVEVVRNIPLLLQLFFWYAIFTEIFPPIKQAWEILPHTFLSQRGLFFPSVSFFGESGLFEVSLPVLQGFGFNGGSTLSPEFISLMLGLVIYTSAFIAEIVRAGILSVDIGQWEAGRSLGLSEIKIMRHIVLPQALRVIIPPLTSQVLNLVKNSSLAIGIGFPDFVAVANTTMNQTGQAIEVVALIMLVYLFFSLSISLFMNIYNKKVVLRGQHG